MDADVQLHGGAVLHLTDVRIGKRTLTAIVDGHRVSLPKDRLLGQKVLLALRRQAGATGTGAVSPSSGESRIAPSPVA